MIVGEDDSGAAVCGRVGDNFADREGRAAFVPFVTRNVKTMRLVIHVRDPQALAVQILFRETTSEKIARGRQAI
jgi:hypothetical protein